MVEFCEYQTVLFDCGGVILNSNLVKTEAFFNIASAYGEEVASNFVTYHQQNGGISRYEKLAYLGSLLTGPAREEFDLQESLASFGQQVKSRLLSCESTQALPRLRILNGDSRWLVVSGSDQMELRDILSTRNMSQYFDGGIFGSPNSKIEIINALLQAGQLFGKTLFLGDSKLDYECAKHFGFDFVFISSWTELRDWEIFCDSELIKSFSSLSEIKK